MERWRLGWSLFLEWVRREEEQAEGNCVALAQETHRTASVPSLGTLALWLQVGPFPQLHPSRLPLPRCPSSLPTTLRFWPPNFSLSLKP